MVSFVQIGTENCNQEQCHFRNFFKSGSSERTQVFLYEQASVFYYDLDLTQHPH
ncbi:hypothetical protein [Flavobacterium sp. RS13.1]|uniref:hypothetical protein n=1 Tax=Flavobacterium sp. RS13.1 TaxID=3400345 RepID=UPI003AAC14B6